MIKVLHVTPAFYPAVYWGGPTYSVYGLCNALGEHTHDVELRVVTSDTAGVRLSDRVEYDSYPVRYEVGYDVYFHRRLICLSFAPGMIKSLIAMARWADVIHLTGVYSFPTIPTLLIAMLKRKPVIWSPRGALQRWDSATHIGVKYVWERICNTLIRKGNCVLHFTTEKEAEESKSRLPKAIAVIIPNGITIPSISNKKLWRHHGRVRLLYIGRLHPIKGIENLLYSLANLPDEYILTICGVGDAYYEEDLHNLVEKLGLTERVVFRGHVARDKKNQAFERADICVVPSYSENFGMVVAESLAHGVPVIASNGTPWSELDEKDCGLWVENDPEPMRNAILQIQRQDLESMGRRGRQWMKESYNWETISEQMLRLYKSMLTKCAE